MRPSSSVISAVHSFCFDAGRFFEMPKNSKPPQPQQSSLAEMWGTGKKKRKVDQPQPAASASDEGEDKKVASEEGCGSGSYSPGGRTQSASASSLSVHSSAQAQGGQSPPPKRTFPHPVFFGAYNTKMTIHRPRQEETRRRLG